MTYLDAVASLRPSAVAIIGSGVTSPERAGETAGLWLGTFLDSAPMEHRLALIDAFFGAVQALAGAFEEIAPGVLGPVPDGAPSDPTLSADALAGVRDALRMLGDGGGCIERRKWLGYASGAVSDERYMAVVLTLVGRSVDLVDGLAAATANPVRVVWGLVQPDLLDWTA